MGKSNKDKKITKVKNHIFKVAGCQSLKAKNKAKAVTNDRSKSIRIKNRQKIEVVDKQLSMLNTEVRQPTMPKPKDDVTCQSSRQTAERVEEIRRYKETEKNCDEALGRLVSMEM